MSDNERERGGFCLEELLLGVKVKVWYVLKVFLKFNGIMYFLGFLVVDMVVFVCVNFKNSKLVYVIFCYWFLVEVKSVVRRFGYLLYGWDFCFWLSVVLFVLCIWIY